MTLPSTGDPRWLTAQWHGRCATCGVTIHRGERGYYDPSTGKMFGSVCRCAYDAEHDIPISARRRRSEISE